MKNSENHSIRIERKGGKNQNVQKRDVSTHFNRMQAYQNRTKHKF